MYDENKWFTVKEVRGLTSHPITAKGRPIIANGGGWGWREVSRGGAFQLDIQK